MKDFKKLFVQPDEFIQKAIEIIDNYKSKFVIVVNEKYELIGTITDGDVRRGLLKGYKLEDPVRSVMNKEPISINEHEPKKASLELMNKYRLSQLPIINKNKRVIGLRLLNELIHKKSQKKDNLVILMAGGLGKRLRPFTDHTPKPLIEINGKPILEIILENMIYEGFTNFFISINYMADKIIDYFGDGSKWQVSIEYLQEKEPLGTAGSLSLLNVVPNKPIIVLNSDLVTKASFQDMLEFHSQQENSELTMGLVEYDFEIPYGIVRLDDGKIVEMKEKPVQNFFVNAGIYIIEPRVLKEIPHNTYMDMTDVIRNIIDTSKKATAYPIREYWIDIGRLQDLKKANDDIDNGLNNI